MITPAFADPLDLRLLSRDPKQWVLLSPLRYTSRVMRARLVVPVGFVTDLASVDRWPLVFWLTAGTAERSAVIHDFLYQTHFCTHQAMADAVFREAMEVEGEPSWRRTLMWWGVRFGGRRAWETGLGRFFMLDNAQSIAAAGEASVLPLPPDDEGGIA